MEKQTKEQAIKDAVAKCPYRDMCEKGFTVLMDGKLQDIRMIKSKNDAVYTTSEKGSENE